LARRTRKKAEKREKGRERAEPRVPGRLEAEAIALGLFAFAGFVAVALVTYSPEDPWWGFGERVANRCGPVGALVAGRAPGDVAGSCDALVDWLYGLAEELAIPRLSDYAVSAADCDRIIERAGSKNNPVPLDRKDMRRILLERI